MKFLKVTEQTIMIIARKFVKAPGDCSLELPEKIGRTGAH